MKFVYCVFQEADDPYSGGPWLERIFEKKEDAVKYVDDHNEFCDKTQGSYAKYFYFYFDKILVY